jgi:hypothetical protein
MIGMLKYRRRAMSSGRLAARPRRWRGERQHGPEHATEFPAPYQDAGGGCTENAEPPERRLQKMIVPPKGRNEVGENIATQ